MPPARATGTTGREVLPGLVSLEGLKAFRTLRQLLQPHPGGVCELPPPPSPSFRWSCVTRAAFPSSLPSLGISCRIRSPPCQTPGKDWEFIQGPGLCWVCTSCKGSTLPRAFIQSPNHSKLIGFCAGMRTICFLLVFIWTSADKSPGIFQTAQPLLRFLQTSPCRQTDSMGGKQPPGRIRYGHLLATPR